jgi:hypothetical protein
MTLQGWARTGADSLGGPGIRQILPALPAGRPARLTSACRTRAGRPAYAAARAGAGVVAWCWRCSRRARARMALSMLWTAAHRWISVVTMSPR